MNDIPRSHRDRRITPRRAEDVALHYASVSLLAAALAAADAEAAALTSGRWGDDHWSLMDGLTSAAEQYRRADAAAHG